MSSDSPASARARIAHRVAEVRRRGPSLSPMDLHARMDEIRQIASVNGFGGLEELARCSAQMALLPGHRVTVRSYLDHVDQALECRSQADTTAMLAALALRLH